MCVLLPEAGATCVSYIVENCCWHKGTRTNILSSYKFSSFSSSDECQWQLVKRNSYWAHIHFYTIKWGNLELRSSKLISETYKREPGPWNKTSHWPEWSVHFFFLKQNYCILIYSQMKTSQLAYGSHPNNCPVPIWPLKRYARTVTQSWKWRNHCLWNLIISRLE